MANTSSAYKGLPRSAPPSDIVDFTNRLMQGRLNATIDITLRAGQVTTTLTDPRISPGSFVDFMPQTANAATAKAGIYITARTKGSCTINHANSANVDQTFTALIIG